MGEDGHIARIPSDLYKCIPGLKAADDVIARYKLPPPSRSLAAMS